MPNGLTEFRIDDGEREWRPLTVAETAAIKRAEADVKAGRLHNHDDVAGRLRRRAAEIVARAAGPSASR